MLLFTEFKMKNGFTRVCVRIYSVQHPLYKGQVVQSRVTLHLETGGSDFTRRWRILTEIKNGKSS